MLSVQAGCLVGTDVMVETVETVVTAAMDGMAEVVLEVVKLAVISST